MIIDCVVTGIEFPTHKPSVKRFMGIIKNLAVRFRPLNLSGCFAPKFFRVSN
jgi:hypothetical protein